MRTSFRCLGLFAAFCLALLLTTAQPSRAEKAFPELVKQWSGLTLQGPGRPVQGLRLSAGHVTLVLANGNAAPVVADGEVVGVFFRGQGTLEYLSADSVEFPIVTYNVRKNTGVTAVAEGKNLAIRDAFKEVLWLAGGIALPSLPTDSSGPPLDEPFALHAKRFGQVYASPITHQFVDWRLNGPDRPMVRAEIAGGSVDLVYVLDALEARSETLMASRESLTIDDRLDLTVLSDQPIERDRRDPLVPRFILADVDLSVTASDGKDVSLSVTETFFATVQPTSVLLLNLYDTMFASSNLGTPQPRRLRVKGVFDEAGAAVPFDHAKDEIAVGLASPLLPGPPLKLRFEIEGDVLYNPGGDSYWELGTGPWFPQPDLSGQYYTVHTTIKVKKPFVPLVPGKTLRRVEEGEWNVLETRIDKPVQFMVIIAGKYSFEEETKNGVTVRVASYAGKNTFGIRKLMNLTHKVIAYYEPFLGPFPFEEFNVVELNSWGFGQAPPAFMFITSEAFNPIGGEINQLFSKGINERFSHEIAHQYWGHVVKMPAYEEQWLTESFAEICAGLFIRDLRGKSDLEGLVATWRSRAKEVSATAPIPLANRIRNKSDPGIAYVHRTYLLYFKGPWILNSIRQQIGEQAFLVFLNSCQATFRWKFGNTKTVQVVLEAITKKDWKPFFDANYWGTAMPEK
jgi:hypothetical protein